LVQRFSKKEVIKMAEDEYQKQLEEMWKELYDCPDED